uniref:peptidyl-tRNA hydrolase n=1 Tax=Leptobrachium leishanense TaxID=445787 RepID=A0A8C5PWS9_9ANUR
LADTNTFQIGGAKKALIVTGNVSAEEAAIFYFDSLEAADGRGKVAAQVGHGAKKVVFQGSNMAHLLELQALDISMNLPTYVVQDAGRTQIGTGSYTVLAIMGEEDFVNLVTGKLKLLN